MRMLLLLIGGASAAGCAPASNASAERSDTVRESDPAAWTRFTSTRVFFAHQSVGWNILDGLGSLDRNAHGPGAQVVNIAKDTVPEGPALMHVEIGRNGEPLSKIRAFRETLEGGLGAKVDLAVLKFCFWDFNRDTDVKAVFAEYESTLSRLHHEFPNVRFVHSTAPLMAADTDWRARVRQLLFLPVPTTLDNAKRHEFSNLIRTRYAGREPIFDIEAAEYGDEDPDDVPSLPHDLTTDGGHLNNDGKRRVAAAFVNSIALAMAPVRERVRVH
jgi:hypothetical protein